MTHVQQPTAVALADRYAAAWNDADLDTIMALQSDDMVFHLHVEGFEPAVGPEAVRAQFAFFFEAWKPMHFETQSLHLSGGLLVRRFRFRATLVQPFPLHGEIIEPTRRPVEVDGADVITIDHELVCSKHTYIDSLAVREQLR